MSRIQELIINPNLMTRSDYEVIKDAVHQTPWVEAYESLYLKATKEFKQEIYQEELDKRAIYITNRTILQQFLNSTPLSYSTPKPTFNEVNLPETVITKSSIDEAHLEEDKYAHLLHQLGLDNLIDHSSEPSIPSVEASSTVNLQPEIVPVETPVIPTIENEAAHHETFNEVVFGTTPELKEVNEEENTIVEDEPVHHETFNEVVFGTTPEPKEVNEKENTIVEDEPVHHEIFNEVVFGAIPEQKDTMETTSENIEPIISEAIIPEEMPIENIETQVSESTQSKIISKEEDIFMVWEPDKIDANYHPIPKSDEIPAGKKSSNTEKEIDTPIDIDPTKKIVSGKNKNTSIESPIGQETQSNQIEEVEYEDVKKEPQFEFSPDQWSFRDWLHANNFKIVPKSTEEIIKKQKIQEKIIDNFIETNPKITIKKEDGKLKPETAETPINTKENTKDISHLMTETLANLYIEQGKYERAILSFKILSLKYPEKSSYFAARIKEINQLKI